MAPLPSEQVVFKTLKTLCESLGFEYHVILVNIDDSSNRHWRSSRGFSSPMTTVARTSTSITGPSLSPSKPKKRRWTEAVVSDTLCATSFNGDNLENGLELQELEDYYRSDALETVAKREVDARSCTDADEDEDREELNAALDQIDYDQVKKGLPLMARDKPKLLNDGTPKRRFRTSLKTKLNLIAFLESGKKQRDAVKDYGLSPSTIFGIWKERDKIKAAAREGVSGDRESLRQSPFSSVEHHLMIWVREMGKQNVPLSGNHIREEARKIAEILGVEEFSGSNGWLNRFKSRYKLRCKETETDE